MVDAKAVVGQVQELQVIIHDIHAENMIISESFQVAAVIEKLPPGWDNFKNYLKHKRKEMTMEDLVVRLRIEEDNRKSEGKHSVATEKANVVEHEQSSKSKKNKFEKGAKLASKGGVSKPSKFQGSASTMTKWVIGLLNARSQRSPTRRKKQTW